MSELTKGRKKMADFTSDEFVEIANLCRSKRSPREVAEQFHTTDSVVRKIYQRVVFSGTAARKGDA